jgi:hypothetical protein
VTKYLRKQFKMRRFILAHGLRVFVHGQLVPLLLDLWQGRNTMHKGLSREKVFTLWQPGSRQRQKEARGKIHLSKLYPQ